LERKKTHIDEQLKGIFNSFEPSVPFAFDAIAGVLDEKKSQRRRILWATAAAVVFTAVSGIYFLAPDTAWVNKNSTHVSETNSSHTSSLSSHGPLMEPSIENTKESVESVSPEVVIKNSVKPSLANFPQAFENREAFNSYNKLKIKQESLESAFWGSNDPELALLTEKTEPSSLWIYTDFSGKSLQIMPNSLGDLLQLPERIQLPQMPKQPLSSWAFEVGYDQNQSAMTYQISPGREKYVHKNYLNRVQEGEFALNAPQLQASLKYSITPRWSVLIGLGMAQTRVLQDFNFQDSVPFSVAQGNASDGLGNYPIFGYLGLGQQVQYEGTNTLHMISIPVGISYAWPLNPFWSLNTEISARYNRILSSNGKTLNYHDLSLQETNSEIFRSQIWSARFSTGIEYRMNLKQYVGLRLNTQGAITPYYLPNASVNNRGWSAGLSVFYTYKLF
jgi:hypothetical protein